MCGPGQVKNFHKEVIFVMNDKNYLALMFGYYAAAIRGDAPLQVNVKNVKDWLGQTPLAAKMSKRLNKEDYQKWLKLTASEIVCQIDGMGLASAETCIQDKHSNQKDERSPLLVLLKAGNSYLNRNVPFKKEDEFARFVAENCNQFFLFGAYRGSRRFEKSCTCCLWPQLGMCGLWKVARLNETQEKEQKARKEVA